MFACYDQTYHVGVPLSFACCPGPESLALRQSACFTRAEMSALVQALDGSKIRKESWNPQRNSSVANQGVVKALSPFPKKCDWSKVIGASTVRPEDKLTVTRSPIWKSGCDCFSTAELYLEGEDFGETPHSELRQRCQGHFYNRWRHVCSPLL